MPFRQACLSVLGCPQVLKDALPTYDIGMLEQMSMVYILMQQPDMIKRMYFEHGYCFNCWYRNMDDSRIDHPAFTVHFAGTLPLLKCLECSVSRALLSPP